MTFEKLQKMVEDYGLQMMENENTNGKVGTYPTYISIEMSEDDTDLFFEFDGNTDNLIKSILVRVYSPAEHIAEVEEKRVEATQNNPSNLNVFYYQLMDHYTGLAVAFQSFQDDLRKTLEKENAPEIYN